MIFDKVEAGIYGANCYIVGCEETKEGFIVDPGGNSEDILKRVNELNIDLKCIILTHGHGDHIGAVSDIVKKTGAKVLIHRQDENMLLDADKNYSSMMNMGRIEVKPDQLLEDGDVVKVGKLDAKIIHTPGHTLGGICIVVDDIMLSGDTLFAGSIGRTDLFGGSYNKLLKSIKEKLFIYDDKVRVFPGHGPATTIGIEGRTNPFVKKY